MTIIRQELAERAASLAVQGVYIGTSSWKYPGWCGMLFDRARYEHRGKIADLFATGFMLLELLFQWICILRFRRESQTCPPYLERFIESVFLLEGLSVIRGNGLFLANREFGVCQLSLLPQPNQVLLDNFLPAHDFRHVEIVYCPRPTNLRILGSHRDCGIHLPIASLYISKLGEGPKGITCFHGQNTAIQNPSHRVDGVNSQETFEVTFGENDRFFVVVRAFMVTKITKLKQNERIGGIGLQSALQCAKSVCKGFRSRSRH